MDGVNGCLNIGGLTREAIDCLKDRRVLKSIVGGDIDDTD